MRHSEFLRFVGVGGVNTLLTYGLYVVSAMVLPYMGAYALAYVAGIGISYLLNARYAFREAYTLRAFVRYPLVYVVQYLLGSALLYGLVAGLSLSKYLAPLFVVAITLPVTFVLSRFLIRGSADKKTAQ